MIALCIYRSSFTECPHPCTSCEFYDGHYCTQHRDGICSVCMGCDLLPEWKRKEEGMNDRRKMFVVGGM